MSLCGSFIFFKCELFPILENISVHFNENAHDTFHNLYYHVLLQNMTFVQEATDFISPAKNISFRQHIILALMVMLKFANFICRVYSLCICGHLPPYKSELMYMQGAPNISTEVNCLQHTNISFFIFVINVWKVKLCQVIQQWQSVFCIFAKKSYSKTNDTFHLTCDRDH